MAECPDVTIALELTGVGKRFGGLTVADGISIAVPEHMIYGIIGPNGAGKTTLFNIITGVYTPTSGRIELFGRDVTGRKTHEIAKLGIARTFQNIRLFDELTVFDNLLTACQKNLHYSLWQSFLHTRAFHEQEQAMSERCYALLRSLGIEHLCDQRAGNLAYGNQRRVEIARALATEPSVLLLDEPAAGMNEDESKVLSEIIMRIRKEFGITILIIDHHMDVIMSVCNLISVINFGQLLITGIPSDIQRNQEVRDAYLGKDEETC